MRTSNKPVEATLVSCEVCLREVPVDEATIPEGVDYFVHFCGLDCYEQWKSRGGKPKEQVAGPGS
jgi:Domain of unknown function (DUF3330)